MWPAGATEEEEAEAKVEVRNSAGRVLGWVSLRRVAVCVRLAVLGQPQAGRIFVVGRTTCANLGF